MSERPNRFCILHSAFCFQNWRSCFSLSLCLGGCLAALLLACAKKALPPNPDRFPPHLAEIRAVNQNRVDLVFDEAMQQKDLGRLDYSVTDMRGDTLELLAVSGGADPTVIVLLTTKQAAEKYTMTGVARDNAGNPAHFVRGFIGSSKPDTVAPIVSGVTPGPYSVAKRRNAAVTITFTKPMDTLSLGSPWILPPGMRTRFGRTWDPSLGVVRFPLTDSLGLDTTITFILPPLAHDFAGNRLAGAAFTVFTLDSAALPRVIHGKADFAGRPPRNSYVAFSQDQPLLAAVVRDDGTFALRTKRESYAVLALADTNYDGYAELVARRDRADLPDTLVVTLAPDSTRTRLDSVFVR